MGMIKASELRIGNLILYLNELYKVSGIRFEENVPSSKWRIFFTTVDGALRNAKMENWIEPIPLTPEILIKCGLDKVYESKMHTNYDADKLGHAEIGYTIWHNSGNRFFRYHSERNVICQYLHQLQNLYFALTNEELKIEL